MPVARAARDTLPTATLTFDVTRGTLRAVIPATSMDAVERDVATLHRLAAQTGAAHPITTVVEQGRTVAPERHRLDAGVKRAFDPGDILNRFRQLPLVLPGIIAAPTEKLLALLHRGKYQIELWPPRRYGGGSEPHWRGGCGRTAAHPNRERQAAFDPTVERCRKEPWRGASCGEVLHVASRQHKVIEGKRVEVIRSYESPRELWELISCTPCRQQRYVMPWRYGLDAQW